MYEYVRPTAPEGSGDVVVILMPGLIVRLKDFVAVADTLSVAWTVKLLVPRTVGVPVIAPDGDKLSPAGRVPDVIDHEYGMFPLLACNVCE